MRAPSRKQDHAARSQAPDPIVGRRVRIRAEGEVLARYDACPTAPERISVRIDGIITIVPVARVEVLS